MISGIQEVTTREEMMKNLSLVLFLVFILSVCGCNRSPESNSSKSDPPQVILSPSSLFTDETRILAPHLDFYSTAVKIEYDGAIKRLFLWI